MAAKCFFENLNSSLRPHSRIALSFHFTIPNDLKKLPFSPRLYYFLVHSSCSKFALLHHRYFEALSSIDIATRYMLHVLLGKRRGRSIPSCRFILSFFFFFLLPGTPLTTWATILPHTVYSSQNMSNACMPYGEATSYPLLLMVFELMEQCIPPPVIKSYQNWFLTQYMDKLKFIEWTNLSIPYIFCHCCNSGAVSWVFPDKSWWLLYQLLFS